MTCGMQRALEEQLASSQERQARMDWEHQQRSSQLAADLRAAREEIQECRSVIAAVQAQARAAAAAASVVQGQRYAGGAGCSGALRPAQKRDRPRTPCNRGGPTRGGGHPLPQKRGA